MSCIRYSIFGRVQGVAYRAFTRDVARRLGIVGWVKNNSDASVECLACTENEVLDKFEAQLKHGPRWARVDRIEMENELDDSNLNSFEVRY